MDVLTAIRRPIEAELSRYKTLFEEALTHQDDYLGSALAYVRQRRGKMMRPILTILVAKNCGEVQTATLRLAVTLELLHTASLVHDDVVDESDERRGQASTNATFGNKVAVLVGDYLLSEALHQSALSGSLRCVDTIARLGGTLSEGEVIQLANIRNEVSTEAAYFDVIRRKTAELFATCAELGAFTMGTDEDFVAHARHFGETIGMCFQIRDDIFDYYEDSAIGKPTGNDMREGKLTLPAIYAINTHGDEEIHAVAKRIKQGTATTDDITRMVAFTKENGGIDYARKVMDDFHEKALEDLRCFSNKEVAEALKTYLDYVIGRDL